MRISRRLPPRVGSCRPTTRRGCVNTKGNVLVSFPRLERGSFAPAIPHHRRIRMRRATRAVIFIALAEIAAGACGRFALAQANTRTSPPAGTYRISICRAPCDPRIQTDIATGTLVLSNRVFAPNSIAEPARSYFAEHERELLVLYAENRPNACFVLEKGAQRNTYAGASRVALTRWSARPNSALGFPMFQTPDAGYSTRVTVSGRDLVGRGESWGPDESMDSIPPDSIFAQRIGPPDLSVCERAAAVEARRRETARRE